MRSIVFDVSVPKVLATQILSAVWSKAWQSGAAPASMIEVERGALNPHHVRLNNRACGICASDLHLLFVDVDPRVHPAALPGYQRIYLGHEVISTVDAVGAEVNALEVGDRVLMRSKFLKATCLSANRAAPCPWCVAGEYALCSGAPPPADAVGVGGGWSDGYDAHPSELWKVPDDMNDDDATLIEPLACSVRAVLRRLPEPGEKVLVVGCGMIGLGVVAALQALAPEAQVYAAARYPQQVAMCERFGATVVGSDLLEAAADITGGKITRAPIPEAIPSALTAGFGGKNRTLLGGGFDVVYDCVASDATIETSLRITRPEGAVVMVGVHLKPSNVDLTPVLFNQVDLLGAMAHGMERWEGQSVSTFDLTAQLIADGRLDTEGFITHRYPLADWKEAVSTATDKHSGCIKVIFEMS